MAIQKTSKNKYTTKPKRAKRIKKRTVKLVKKTNLKKKSYRKPRAKKLTTQQLQLLKASKPASMELNADFYRSAEGVYTSYWLGKFMSTILHDGKKKTVAKYVYKALAQIKFSIHGNPLLLFLEVLDKIKPTFRLRNYIVRRVIIKEFPIVVLRPRRLILAIHWLKEEVQSNSGKFAVSLDNQIVTKLLDFRLNPKKNNLVKKRNEFIKRTIKAQFNIRYNFK